MVPDHFISPSCYRKGSFYFSQNGLQPLWTSSWRKVYQHLNIWYILETFFKWPPVANIYSNSLRQRKILLKIITSLQATWFREVLSDTCLQVEVSLLWTFLQGLWSGLYSMTRWIASTTTPSPYKPPEKEPSSTLSFNSSKCFFHISWKCWQCWSLQK